MKKKIQELIVVEGKDDVSAVLRAVDASVITTNGMGLTDKRLAEIAALGRRQGVIILTDPDVPGTLIRNRVTEVFPEAKQAFITRADARHPVTGRLGVEYASPKTILAALEACYATDTTQPPRYTMSDLVRWKLCGGKGTAERRAHFCDILGLGQANGKTLLKRMNSFSMPEDAIMEALAQLEEKQ